MGWADSLRGLVIGVDSAPLIYYIESHPDYVPIVRPFFEGLRSGEFQAVTSVVTLMEVLVHPFRRNDREVADKYRDILLHSDYLSCNDITAQIAEEAARLRSQHNLRTPDAIQLAAAVHGGASAFLTNDTRLPSLPGLRILVLDQLRSQA